MAVPGVETNAPRVLVVSPHPIGPSDGTGLYSLALLRGWPPERLASAYSLPGRSEDTSACQAFYRLDPRLSADPIAWIRRAAKYLLGISETLDGVATLRMTKALRAWLDDFSPDVVYSHLGSITMTRLAMRVARDYRAPLVIHINDDYITDWPAMGISGRNIFPATQILRALNKRAFVRAIERATTRLVVSPTMKTEYERRYKVPFEIVDKGIETGDWVDQPPFVRSPGKPFRVFYGGTISQNKNLDSIRDVGVAVATLSAEGRDISFDVATSVTETETDAWIKDLTNVRRIPFVPREELPRRLSEYDLLLLPFSFTEGCIRYIRYSWPTKMPEYMASRVPVLMYGPLEAGFVEYARNEGWAHVIERRDQEYLTATLRRLLDDDRFLAKPVERARALASTRHDMRVVRSRFQAALFAAATPQSGIAGQPTRSGRR